MIPCLQHLLPNIPTTLLLLLIFLAMTIKLLRGGSFQPLKFQGKVLGKISSYPTPTSKVSSHASGFEFCFLLSLVDISELGRNNTIAFYRICFKKKHKSSKVHGSRYCQLKECNIGSAPAASRWLFHKARYSLHELQVFFQTLQGQIPQLNGL